MKYSIKTDKGKVRRINQDNCIVTQLDDQSLLAVVCDGMGGSNAGEIASEMTMDVVCERIKSSWRSNITAQSIINLLTTAITAANICVFDKANEDKCYDGMGTTLVAVIIKKDDIIIANIGDSRAYIINDEVRYVTKDHSLVQELVDAGTLTPEEAIKHPQKNYITRAIGVEEEIDIDFSEHKLIAGDKILICSDGLYNYVSLQKIKEIISSNNTEDCADILVSEANKNGGGDNIAAILISEK